ncbi:dienelactone hydrolase family protein [Candidatus Binatus sp.]|uniref:dienelactone hydrolase family protein n=1 Tax=Candidatus Binatus sp. TaxID=2811406 RepID=UPI003C6F69CB
MLLMKKPAATLIPTRWIFWATILSLVLLGTACSSVPSSSEGSTPIPSADSVVRFTSADGKTSLHGVLSVPRGNGPFASVIILESELCEGGFPEWASGTLNSWGYATLTVDSYAGRNLAPGACIDLTALQPADTVGDVYGALRVLERDPRIDANRVALLGTWDGSTTIIVADTLEAEHRYVTGGMIAFRAFFAISPFCRIELAGADLRPYAPERIYVGERDDMAPAAACVQMAKFLDSEGGDVSVKVYPGAEHGFDYVPPALVTPPMDSEALHPHGEDFTYPLRPYYVPFADNLAACSFRITSISQKTTQSEVSRCVRKGVHTASDPAAAYSMQDDLEGSLARFLSGGQRVLQ